ncbi:MAG TPA: DNA gyrase inhibitor YacG [Allosphingosinicella sp.]
MSRAASPKPCPLCGKPPSAADAPFCSRGCRDRDLLKWLGEGYRVPGPPAHESDGDSGSSGLDSDG